MLGAARSHAGILYSQSSTYPGSINATTSQSQGTGGSFQSWDNFSVSTAGSVASLSWQGLFFDPTNSINPFSLSSTPTFQIGFFQNTNNLPGAVIGSAISLNNLQYAFVGNALFGPDNFGHNDPVKVYNFTANLATSFTPTLNVPYWLSIVSFTSTSPAVWLWTSGTGGDGKSAQKNYGSPNTTYTVGDRAFSLSTDPAQLLLTSSGPDNPPAGLSQDTVPEPGAVRLLVLSLLPLLRRARRPLLGHARSLLRHARTLLERACPVLRRARIVGTHGAPQPGVLVVEHRLRRTPLRLCGIPHRAALAAHGAACPHAADPNDRAYREAGQRKRGGHHQKQLLQRCGRLCRHRVRCGGRNLICRGLLPFLGLQRLADGRTCGCGLEIAWIG
jgi:hypothetical protein